MDFEWDEVKNQANIAKHGIGFRGAARIFDGPTLELEDARRDYGETRIARNWLIRGRRDLCSLHHARPDVQDYFSQESQKR
jgi:uncharacterized DUF497 family protein